MLTIFGQWVQSPGTCFSCAHDIRFKIDLNKYVEFSFCVHRMDQEILMPPAKKCCQINSWTMLNLSYISEYNITELTQLR